MMNKVKIRFNDALKKAMVRHKDERTKSQRQISIEQVPDNELSAVAIIRRSETYSGLGACTHCLLKLKDEEMEHVRAQYKLIDRM